MANAVTTTTRDATIYDVAAKAGVSVSTVSLAMNNPGRVRSATLSRIMAAVDELEFVPKHHAVTRARRGLRRIGVLAPFSSFPSFARRLNGVLRVATPEGVEVTIFDQASATESVLESLPLTRRVDGLIVMSLPLSDRVAERLIEQRLPTVLIELGHPSFSGVTIDDAAGGRMVAELLLAKGHERFCYLGHAQNSEYRSQSALRLDGFTEGLPTPPDVRLVEHSIAAAQACSVQLLSAANPPTAIFAHDDLLATGVLRGARQLGLATPDEIAVVGFDDSELAEAAGLTSVRQPFEESGQIAAETLLSQLADPITPMRNTALRLTLVERETT